MFDYIKRLDELCRSRKWTYYELARQADISPNTLYNWAGKKTVPSISVFEKIAAAFDITVEQFFCSFESSTLSDSEKEILTKWNLMSDFEKDIILDLAESFETFKRITTDTNN